MFRDRAILYLAIGQTLTWAGLFYVFPALLVRWETALGWSRTDLTAAITLAVFLSAVCSPLTGRLIDKGRGPLMMTACTALGGISLIGLALVTALWQFYLVWALLGMLMAGALYDPCFAMVTRARGAGARRGIILITLVAGFASTISFPAAHALSEAYGWRVAIGIFAFIVICVSAPLIWRGTHLLEPRSKADARPAEVSAPRHDFLKNPVFWLLALSLAFIGVVHSVTLQHLLPILHDRGISANMAVVAASFIGPMQVLGRIVFMASEKHVTNHGVALGCFIFMGASIALLIGVQSTPILLAGFVILFGSAYGTLSIIRPLVTRDVLGEENFGAKTGALAVPYLIGAASAPYLGSLIWNLGGYDLVLPGLIGVAALGLGLYQAAHRSLQKSASIERG